MTASRLSRSTFKLKQELSAQSFAHCARSAEMAAGLARAHGCDIEQAQVAALLHDAARDLSDAELLKRAGEFGIEVNWVEEKRPYLLHAAVGAKIIADEYDIDDSAIAQAVERHTFGAKSMTELNKIVYLADIIESKRDPASLGRIRALAERDMDAGFAAAYLETLAGIIEKGSYLHPRTVEVWNEIVQRGELVWVRS